ncbi:hypothetical protein [Alkalicoccobacillus porphyridii]|uniref:Uncharacterized protein n=1 Tax=Alkalicoccobacillus porphyridii TaxID=2597270 RepID=A0A553ZX05_9BACI|nr:hypothetical protein [Alkalicoccobacillus porphyridii]TSB45876.1 hypothetical protein FN960_13240 [Alkalicoccobacillus porphyridii]
MNKLKKVIGSVAVIGLLLSGTGAIAHAATYYAYSATVPVINDYETASKTKATTGSAYNSVTAIQKDRKLTSWIENTGGSNLTTKVTYSSTGSKTMDFKGNASEVKGKSVRLNISTATSELNTATTSGSWTPN